MPEEIPLDKNCQIIAVEEPGIYIIDKSHGVLSHPNEYQKTESHKKTLLKADYCMKRQRLNQHEKPIWSNKWKDKIF